MNPDARIEPSAPVINRLSDYLCFAIYSINLACGRAYKPILEELGLTYTQYIAIIALWEEEHHTVSSLGEKLFLDSSTLTPMLKRLEIMGYVWRRRAATDERQVRIGLTKAGNRLRESAIGKDIFSHTQLTLEQTIQLQQALVEVRNSLLVTSSQ